MRKCCILSGLLWRSTCCATLTRASYGSMRQHSLQSNSAAATRAANSAVLGVGVSCPVVLHNHRKTSIPPVVGSENATVIGGAILGEPDNRFPQVIGSRMRVAGSKFQDRWIQKALLARRVDHQADSCGRGSSLLSPSLRSALVLHVFCCCAPRSEACEMVGSSVH